MDSYKLSGLSFRLLTLRVVPYFKIFADGDACAPWPGPFLAQYSFLENAEYIPGDLLNRLEAFPIAQSLRKKFAEAKTIALGGRAFFGYDVSSRRCGDYEFKGLNGDVITVTIFFAHKELITVDTQGNFNAGRKHMTMIMRDASSTVTMCSYSASHNYWNGKSIPAQKLNPSPTPSHTPTNTPTPSVTPSKGSPPSPTPRAASGSVSSSSSTSSCFPASALVFLLNGSIRSMSDLQIGDQVLVGAEKHSPVFMFTHRLTNGTFEFLRFVFEDASDLRVTPGHYLYANGILKAARDVSVGDKLEKVTGDSTTISCIETVYETGLYNPQTEQGDIVVNGIRVSTYTESISPNAAHAFLSAFRFAHRYMDLTCRSMENGLDFSVI